MIFGVTKVRDKFFCLLWFVKRAQTKFHAIP